MEDKIGFEAAMKELEDIVQTLEKGGISLDESMKLFQNGTQLVKICQKELSTAQQEIKKLIDLDTDNPEVVDLTEGDRPYDLS